MCIGELRKNLLYSLDIQYLPLIMFFSPQIQALFRRGPGKRATLHSFEANVFLDIIFIACSVTVYDMYYTIMITVW